MSANNKRKREEDSEDEIDQENNIRRSIEKFRKYAANLGINLPAPRGDESQEDALQGLRAPFYTEESFSK